MPKLNPENLRIGKEISERFFIAKNELKDLGKFETNAGFARGIKMGRPAMVSFPDRENAQLGLHNICYACSHYQINVNWLFTGEGDMFIEDKLLPPIGKKAAVKKMITLRFGTALEDLINRKIIYNPRDIAKMAKYSDQHVYDMINTGNKTVPLSFCYIMINKYHLNANWLFLNIGSMFTK